MMTPLSKESLNVFISLFSEAGKMFLPFGGKEMAEVAICQLMISWHSTRTETTPVIYDYRDIQVDYLKKLYRQRSRFYQKLLQTGQIQRLDELMLIFNEDKVFINTDATILQIDQLDLPIQIEKFKPEVAWKIRVLNYDEENAEIKAEIIDYTADPEINTGNQISLQFQPIEKIRFRSLNTDRL